MRDEPEPVSNPPIRRQLITMIEDDGIEPPKGLSDHQAEATWAAVSALWHPAILSRIDTLPTIENATKTPIFELGQIRVLAEGARPPIDLRSLATEACAIVLDGEIDRTHLAHRVLEILEPGADFGTANDSIALDFFALGTMRWWLRDLTTAMGHADCLDIESLTRETLAGAKAWLDGDRSSATNHLRAAFEVLTQARERFYPVDAYLIDVCLLDPSLPGGVLAESLDARAPFTVLASAKAIEAQAAIDPERIGALREAITEGWADVVGGSYSEVDECLLPIGSILWQFRKGAATYRTHLEERNVETLASRRFALHPQRAQIGRRFGFRFAYHVGLDDGRFPVPLESKRLWESPDGSHLESLIRPPIAADRPSEGLRLPWRIGRCMKDDHVATIVLAHWPSPVAGWYRDLRIVAKYSPVLLRWVTVGDYFHHSDRPWERLSPKLDEYVTPYLAQAVARREPAPISNRAVHARLRAKLDSLRTLDALGRALTTTPSAPNSAIDPDRPIGPESSKFADIEELLETGQFDDAKARLTGEEAAVFATLAQAINQSAEQHQPGYLVFNPLNISRRAAVFLPGAALDLKSKRPLRAVQPGDQGVSAVVDLPPFGFAWMPRDATSEQSPAQANDVSAEGRTLKNESVEVEFDTATGGLRAIRARGEETARLGLQLILSDRRDAEGHAAITKMVSESFTIEHSGPALAQAVSRGVLNDPKSGQPLARFELDARLWSGRTTLDLQFRILNLESALASWLAEGDPWTRFLACRWAWPDSNATLRRSSLLSLFPTDAERPETPDLLEIASRTHHTALLFGGLAHHRRIGNRMLDTLLISGRETARSFHVGIALDLDHPFHAALDFIAPAPVVSTESGPPRVGPVGWLVQVDHKAVAVISLDFVEHTGEGRGWGLALIVLETSGRPCRARVRFFLHPSWARQTDFTGELIFDLGLDGDSISIDLTPHEMMRIEVTMAPVSGR